jgi:hypothetical protein
MKGSLNRGEASKFAGCIAVLAGALSLSSVAHAEYVGMDTPFDQGAPLQSLMQGSTPGGTSIRATQLVWGSSLTVNSLSLPSAGLLTVKLTDIKWTETLDSLSLLVTDLDGMWNRLDGSGNLLIHVSGPTQLFAAVFASSGEGDVGVYNLQASFSPVPLPAAGWLLLSGLGAMGALRRKAAAKS